MSSIVETLPMPGEGWPSPGDWEECGPEDDRTGWNPKVARLFDYWLSISPKGLLPGRQHFDPIDVAAIMPNVWMLDVVRDGVGTRYRYRLVGTAEVTTLQREVTGLWFDQVHGEGSAIYRRFEHMIDRRAATFRKGMVGLSHREDHRVVENCMVPFARDGVLVDMIVACSILFNANGEVVC